MSGRGRETRAQQPGPGGVGRSAPNDQVRAGSGDRPRRPGPGGVGRPTPNDPDRQAHPHLPQIREKPAGKTRTVRKS